jgi:hypothetical protein
MLSFNNLGNLGRLANQMFQYASLKGIATNRGFDFCIPPKEVFGVFDPNVRRDKLCIYDLFELEKTNNINLTSNKILREERFDFNEEIFNNCEDDLDILGYFQSEKYFKHIEDEIRSDFTFKESILSNCKSFYDEHFVDTEVISLHVRRGDYLNNPNHPVQSLEYYQEALSNFDENTPVIVFSDDQKWCSSQELFSGNRFFISQGEDPTADLCIMSMCDYHIIANSSYSWWGAWLANSKKIIAPKNWFGGQCIDKDVKDMEFGNWVWINNT